MVEKTVEIIQRLNTYGVISGYPVERVRRFHRAAPGRLIPAYQLNLGHGTYLSPDVLRHYEYASGHEGDSALAGFAARGRELVVYLAEGAFSEPVKSTLGRQT